MKTSQLLINQSLAALPDLRLDLGQATLMSCSISAAKPGTVPRTDRNLGQNQEQERQLRQQILSAAQAAATQAGELPPDSHNTNAPAISQAVPALIAELSAIDVTSQTITSMQVRPAALLQAG